MKLDLELQTPLPPHHTTGQQVLSAEAPELDPAALLRNGFVGFFPLDPRARPFLQLRSQLRKLLAQRGQSVLAITSVQAGDGKTFVAANLAAAMSVVHPTVLVDLDLRRSTLTQRLAMPMRAGIDDYLIGIAGWHSTALHLRDHRLTIHGVRQTRQDACSLIASRRFEDMGRLIRALPDAPICILDTPPVLICDEVASIGKVADAVLLVVDEGRTSRAALVEAARLLSPTPVIGSILNRSMTGDRSRREYANYYKPRP